MPERELIMSLKSRAQASALAILSTVAVVVIYLACLFVGTNAVPL